MKNGEKKTKHLARNIAVFSITVTVSLTPSSIYCQSIGSSYNVTTTVSENKNEKEVNDTKQNNLMDQIRLFFNIGETTRALNMEEQGISGLNDTAGQSLGAQKLFEMKKEYRQRLEKNADDALTWVSLGSVLETLGEEEQALAAYLEANKINPNNQAVQQGIRRYDISHQILARVYYSFQHQKEYAPSIGSNIATWEEQAMNVQVSKSWGQGKTLGIGWLESTITQDNDLYGDVDFSLKRQAPFISFSWPVMEKTSMAIRIRDEKFTNDDDSGFYKVDGSEHIVTGYFAMAYRGDGYWTNFNYSREREPDPVYDLVNGRSALNIEVKQLTGVSGGYAIAPTWELGSSLYYEQYGSDRDDQFNPNLQLSHWLSWLPGARVSLGYGYYSEERENIVNLTTSYQWQARDNLQFRFEYQMEYSGNEDSLLNQGDVLISWNIIDRLAMVIRVDYSQESSGDKDKNFYAQSSLNWSFY